MKRSADDDDSPAEYGVEVEENKLASDRAIKQVKITQIKQTHAPYALIEGPEPS